MLHVSSLTRARAIDTTTTLACEICGLWAVRHLWAARLWAVWHLWTAHGSSQHFLDNAPCHLTRLVPRPNERSFLCSLKPLPILAAVAPPPLRRYEGVVEDFAAAGRAAEAFAAEHDATNGRHGGGEGGGEWGGGVNDDGDDGDDGDRAYFAKGGYIAAEVAWRRWLFGHLTRYRKVRYARALVHTCAAASC